MVTVMRHGRVVARRRASGGNQSDSSGSVRVPAGTAGSPVSGVEDVGAWGVDDRPQAGAAEFARRGLVRSAPVTQPRQQVGPPAALLRVGGSQPLRRIGGG